MRKTKKVVTTALALTMVSSIAMSVNEVYARSSKRATWNNAAGSKTDSATVKDKCYTEDGSESEEHTVNSNVYADSEEWQAWKDNWDTVKNKYCQVALTPGKNETELNFAWYSLTEETPKVILMDSTGNVIKTFEGTQTKEKTETVTDGSSTVTLIPCKVTATGLNENTSYKYKYVVNGQESETYDYNTYSKDSFSVMYVGDPQIGASVGQDNESKEYHAMNDAYNWNKTLESAVSAHKNLSFILSAGDQINQTKVNDDAGRYEQQIEYSGFLSSPVLRSIPLATTIGNHDSKSFNYSNHFNNPNEAVGATSATAAGNDYYFRYGNALFISIDTNNYNCADHENLIKYAVEHNTDAKWRILMFHQDIYGSGYDHSDTDGMILRTQLTPIIDKYDFDAVLQGHDHTYSRTKQISSDGKTHESYTNAPTPDMGVFEHYLDENNCYNILDNSTDSSKVIDPEGTVYFEANSATGSKFYQLIGTQQDYIARRSQSWRPTYSVIDITETTLTVTTYDAATNTQLVADGNQSTKYTIVKQADKTSLTESIEKANSKYDEAVAAGTYTDESLATLKNTIEAAKNILSNEEAKNADIASAVTSLDDAVNGLTLKQTDNAGNGQSNTDNQNKDANAQNVSNVDNGTSNNGSSSAAKDNKTTTTSSTGTKNPKTGDSVAPIVGWTALGTSAFAGLAGIYLYDRKKKKICQVADEMENEE